MASKQTKRAAAEKDAPPRAERTTSGPEITGAVAYGNRTYRKGDEEALQAALDAEGAEPVDVARWEALDAAHGFTQKSRK